MNVRKHRKSMALFMAFLMVVGLIAGCSGESKETSEGTHEVKVKYKEEVVIGVVGNPETLDPNSSTSKKTLRTGVNIFETLVGFDVDKKEIVPRLAKSWEMPANNEYIFHLREDVKFHNGNPMTVKDVVYSLQRCQELPAAVPFVNLINKLEVIDEHTLKITLKDPSPVFLGNLTHNVTAIIPEGAGDTIGDKPIGTGPFFLAEYSVDDYILLERFPDYWGEKNPTQRLRLRIMPDHNARNMALEAGDIDVSLMIYSVDYSSLKAREDIVCHKEPSVQVEYLAMNVSKAPFNDVHVRRAVAYAINTDAVVNGIYEGDVAIAKSMVSSQVMGYDENVKYYAYNVDKAKEELAKSKYSNGFEFTCYTTQSRARYTEALQYDLSLLGIKMNVEFVQNVQETIRGGYEGAHITGITFDSFDMDPLYRYLHSSTHGAGGNLTWYNNPVMDELLERSRTEMDSQKRAQILNEVQELLYQDVPLVPIFARTATAGYVKGTKGFRPYPNEVDILTGIYVEIQE